MVERTGTVSCSLTKCDTCSRWTEILVQEDSPILAAMRTCFLRDCEQRRGIEPLI